MPTALSTLLPLMNAPRCPQPRLLQALRNACRAFCRDTEVWREILTSFPTVADQAAYTVATGQSDTLFIRLFSVKVDGAFVHDSEWTFSEAGVLSFRNAPRVAGLPIVCHAVLTPTILCNTVADKIVARWGEYLAAGAEFTVKSDKGTELDPHPWFDPNGAALARVRYDEGVGKAKMEVFDAMQSGNTFIKPYGGIWR
jgi:hypothetical protein